MRRRAAAAIALATLLAAGELWLIFSAGAFFAGPTATAAIVVGVALAAWIALAPRPWDGLTTTGGVASAAFAAFAVWTLASRGWSGADGRAVIEFDRALLYALAVALGALAGGAPVVRRALPWAVAAAPAIACACGLVTRLLPGLWPVPADLEFERLSFPITYWNAQGAMAALALVACLHLAVSLRERAVVRALGAGAVPVVAAALLLTFSRGAIAVAPIGVIAYLLLARPRGAPAALLAIVPPTAAALVAVYGAGGVIAATAASQVPVGEGRGVALVVAACAGAAAALRVVLRPLDAWAMRRRPRAPLGRRRAAALAATAVVAGAVVAGAVGAPARVAAEADRLGTASFVEHVDDSRGRLTSLADNGRVEQWRVALDAFDREPLHGSGAGTYALLWVQGRRIDQDVVDGHSLYLEVLAELGVAGAALLVAGLGALLVGAARRRGALACTVLVVWGLHAGLDWDWELPGLTLPVLALAAATGAKPRAAGTRVRAPGIAVRVLAAAAVLAVLVVPLAVARSQSRLDGAAAALHDGHCPAAIAAARASTDALSWRPEPLQIVALCQARLGDPGAGERTMRAALRRDPRNWRLLYDLGVLRAAAARDPRPLLLAARRRNPRSALVRFALRRFDTASPREWRRRARTVPVAL